jgi:hypothetical protein
MVIYWDLAISNLFGIQSIFLERQITYRMMLKLRLEYLFHLGAQLMLPSLRHHSQVECFWALVISSSQLVVIVGKLQTALHINSKKYLDKK